VNKGVTLLFQEKPMAPEWLRSAFNGLAQIIVQSARQPGEIVLTAKSRGLSQATLKIEAQPAPLRPAVAVR
jgi:beta-galactosidase